MSSIDNKGENEFADDESNLVGKSEEDEEAEVDQLVLDTNKKRNSKDESKPS
ncbi:MAG: hypothetical protein H0X03_04940 [Nitrosopumilus sp.]|nr:hypothetical protein [Nitrosopumilus sp.]